MFVEPVHSRSNLCVSNWWQAIPYIRVPSWWGVVHAVRERRYIYGRYSMVSQDMVLSYLYQTSEINYSSLWFSQHLKMTTITR